MTTAREQAREAARDKVLNGPGDGYPLDEVADAASDVWEPLARELYEALKDVSSWASPPVTIIDRAEAAMQRGRELL